jgi:hypothetical protein
MATLRDVAKSGGASGHFSALPVLKRDTFSRERPQAAPMAARFLRLFRGLASFSSLVGRLVSGGRVTVRFGCVADGGHVITLGVVLGRGAVRLGRHFMNVRGLVVGLLRRFGLFLVFLWHVFPYR